MEDIRRLLSTCKHFLVCTGAGMSVDSGFPAYHTLYGVWGSSYDKLYESYGLTRELIQNFGKPGVFRDYEQEFWRYFFDLFKLYSTTPPHQGYTALQELIGDSYFVVTSNIDGAHRVSGLDPSRILECHGTMLGTDSNQVSYGVPVQCTLGDLCSEQVWTYFFPMFVETSSDLREHYLPRCSCCNQIARPNVLSFNDQYCLVNNFGLNSASRETMREWLQNVKSSGEQLAILEIGVGDQVLTIKNRARMTHQQLANSVLIRINPEPDPMVFTLEMGAKEALLHLSSGAKSN